MGNFIDNRWTNPKDRPDFINGLKKLGFWWSKTNHGQIVHPKKMIGGMYKNMWGGYKFDYKIDEDKWHSDFDKENYDKCGTTDIKEIKNILKKTMNGEMKLENGLPLNDKFEPIK